MDDNTCLELLLNEVTEGGEKVDQSLIEIGYKIVRKCDGLPLAVKAVAGVLRLKDKNATEWDKVLENELWSTSPFENEVPRALYLSYEDLQPNLKQCFLYSSLVCAVFQKACMNDLVRYWVDEGFIIAKENILMEDAAEDCYWELIKRNLLQTSSQGYLNHLCTMHDLLQSLGQFLMNDNAISINGEQRVPSNSSLKLRRLFISNTGDMLKVPDGVTGSRHLRTLFIIECYPTKSLQDALSKSLRNLQILMLSDSKIEELPDFIGDLLHLRHLDIDRTNVKELPNSIGGLSNLQTLRAGGCDLLRRLPHTVTRLHKLRLLDVDGTPLSHVPKGIGKLRNLNTIRGLIVGHDELGKKGKKGCDLDELKHLSNLRDLGLHQLHRASGENVASVLADKPFLTHLLLSETPNLSLSEEKIRRTQAIYNDLTPPSTLRTLRVENFLGLEFPRWMMSSSLDHSFPNLRSLYIWDATSCRELPPYLNQLPWLEYLHIRSAAAITKTGPQFFACQPGAIAFPNLHEIEFSIMPKWEEWSSSNEIELAGREGLTKVNMQLLPRLFKLSLICCPELKTFPECLSLATNLRQLLVVKTQLTKIGNLPRLEIMNVQECHKLKELSNLPSLRKLTISSCPTLESVDSLDALQELSSRISAKHLPLWLSRLALQSVFEKLDMHCDLEVLKACLRGGSNWDVIHRIPNVAISTFDQSAFLRYTMTPHFYMTNAQSE